MYNNKIEEFIAKFDGFAGWDAKKQVDYFAYFLTTGQSSFTAKQIDNCFSEVSIKKYSRTAAYLSEQAKLRGGKYIKCEKGYKLERSILDEIRKQVENEPKQIQVSQQLLDQIEKLGDSQEKLFLEETIKCYRVEAFRAAIVLTWMLVVYHLQNYIFLDNNRLTNFNNALSKAPDKKISKIANEDDFSELKETKFIELMRSAGIISNDVRKILDDKLGIRNSAAHPSQITFDSHKTTEFISDLVNNILLKY